MKSSSSALTTKEPQRGPCVASDNRMPRRVLYSTGFTRSHFVPLGFLAMALAVMPLDIPLACFVHEIRAAETPYWFRSLAKTCSLSEVISHGIGVMMVLLGVYALDREHRQVLPRLLACSFVSGLLALACKSLIVRKRPLHFTPEYLAGHVTETFGSWLPWMTDGAASNDLRSFPSAHTATAFGLAVGLSWLYPQARWFFFLIASLAACQRIVVEAHFMSDVIIGCAIGIALALLFVGPGHLGRLFAWLEQPRESI